MQRDNKTKEQSSKWWPCYLIFVENDTNRRMFEDPHAEPPPPETPSLGSVFGMFGPQTQTNQWHSTCTTRILLVTFYHCHSFCYIFIMFVENKEWTLLFFCWTDENHRVSKTFILICTVLIGIPKVLFRSVWFWVIYKELCTLWRHVETLPV